MACAYYIMRSHAVSRSYSCVDGGIVTTARRSCQKGSDIIHFDGENLNLSQNNSVECQAL